MYFFSQLVNYCSNSKCRAPFTQVSFVSCFIEYKVCFHANVVPRAFSFRKWAGALEWRLPLLHDFKSFVTFSQTLYPNCAVEAHILRYLPYVNSIDKPNFRPKTDTRSPQNKFRFQTQVSVCTISVILWTSNLSGFGNQKTCVCSFDLFGFYWLNTDAFGVCCRLEDAIIVDAAAAFSVTTAQISQLRKFNMVYCIISCRCHSVLSRSQLITREDILSC